MHVYIHRFPVAVVLCDVLRATNREKVQRVIFATFRVSLWYLLWMYVRMYVMVH